MTNNKLSKDEKQFELLKYRELVLATIDYYLDNEKMLINSTGFDFVEHYKNLRMQAEEHFQKGRLTRLKQWFHDLTEMFVETVDLKFNKYLRDKTRFDIDIFKSYHQRIEKIIEKGKITSANQFYDVNIFINQLCQTEFTDKGKIDILNRLLSNYEQRKIKLNINNEKEQI